MKSDAVLLPAARRIWRRLPRRFRAAMWTWLGDKIPYQRVVYKGRILARGRDRTGAYRIVFPGPPVRKTILDAGCHVGAYCFMAASEGAEFCVGIDLHRKRLEKARTLSRRAGARNIQFINADFLTVSLDRTFDVVLCLNLLHHMQTIERVDTLLRKLYALANERLVLIVPTCTDPGQPYECVIRDGIRQVLISVRYLQQMYGSERVEFRALDRRFYGPGKAVFTIWARSNADDSVGQGPGERD